MSFFINMITTKATTKSPLLSKISMTIFINIIATEQQLQKSPLLFKMFIKVRRARNSGDGLLS